MIVVQYSAERVAFTATSTLCDKDGRFYRVRVSARDRAGNLGFPEVAVVVPHDRR